MLHIQASTAVRRAKIVLTAVLLFSAIPGIAAAEGRYGETEERLKVAALFPGSVQDTDYNSLGYIALQDVGRQYNVETAYSEKVPPADVKQVIGEYVHAGYDVLWLHGAQFNEAVYAVGDTYPQTTFIVEVDHEPQRPRQNFFYIQRNYYIGFYVLGRLAALKTHTGTVGYIGGMELPFTRGEINALRQAFAESGREVSFRYRFTGDFNDPVAAGRAAEELISGGADVLISAVNLGNFGIYKAVKQAGRPVFFTTTYTSKEERAPDHYLTSDLFDFTVPIREIVTRIMRGKESGVIPMEYGPKKARYTELPVKNCSEELNSVIRTIARKVASGKIAVEKRFENIGE
jgi:basic membrane protein A